MSPAEARTPIEVDCSGWGETRTPPQSRGKFVSLSETRPAVVVDCSGWAEPTATIALKLPSVSEAAGKAMFEKLNSVIRIINEIEALFDRPGVWVDGNRSGAQNGEVVMVLAPNDPADASETCKRVANILFSASPGLTVKVFVAHKPETPVYELAA